MAEDIISKKTRYEFREYFVGRTLREIESEFDAADVPFDEKYEPTTSGQRRSLVEQYYHAVDWTKWNDVRKILTVYENILVTLEELSESEGEDTFGYKEQTQKSFSSLKKWLERDGFSYADGRISRIGKDISLAEIKNATSHFDAPELYRQIERIKSALEDDPALAIGTAKELVETTCKIILSERGIDYADNLDIAKLVKETRKMLGLVPDNISDSAKGSEIIRRLLSNLGSIAQGLGELRNIYGTGHGKHGQAKGLTARHARLAVGAASTLATFLFETHQERKL